MLSRPTIKLDAFEQPLRDDPANYDGQGKSQAQETHDSMKMLVLVFSALLLAGLGLGFVVAVMYVIGQ